MTKLSVNINKLATLRNSRGKNNPDLVKSALDLIDFGAQGITVHPRPDERHVRRSDVYALRKIVTTVEFNIEGYPSEDFLKMVEEVAPEQCTLVPDPPEALTSNAGWLVGKNADLLARVAQRLKSKNVRTSVFVDPETMAPEDYTTLKTCGVDRVELYTEKFAETFGHATEVLVTGSYVRAAVLARQAGLGVNAGHDLTIPNLEALVTAIPWIDEVSIGHALVCDALYLGFEETIRQYLAAIREGAKKAAARVSTPG